MSPGEDQLSRRPSSQLMGCVMLGNFTPVRDLLCALWRERESERAALPPTARDSKKGGKKAQPAGNITCRAKQRWISPVGNRHPCCFPVCQRLTACRRIRSSVFSVFCIRKKKRRAVLSFLRTRDLVDARSGDDGPRFRREFALGAGPCAHMGTVALPARFV